MPSQRVVNASACIYSISGDHRMQTTQSAIGQRTVTGKISHLSTEICVQCSPVYLSSQTTPSQSTVCALPKGDCGNLTFFKVSIQTTWLILYLTSQLVAQKFLFVLQCVSSTSLLCLIHVPFSPGSDHSLTFPCWIMPWEAHLPMKAGSGASRNPAHHTFRQSLPAVKAWQMNKLLRVNSLGMVCRHYKHIYRSWGFHFVCVSF